jgi:hypothetical protein
MECKLRYGRSETAVIILRTGNNYRIGATSANTIGSQQIVFTEIIFKAGAVWILQLSVARL